MDETRNSGIIKLAAFHTLMIANVFEKIEELNHVLFHPFPTNGFTN